MTCADNAHIHSSISSLCHCDPQSARGHTHIGESGEGGYMIPLLFFCSTQENLAIKGLSTRIITPQVWMIELKLGSNLCNNAFSLAHHTHTHTRADTGLDDRVKVRLKSMQ